MRSTVRVLALLLGRAALGPMQVAWAQTIDASPGKDDATCNATPNVHYPSVSTTADSVSTLKAGVMRAFSFHLLCLAAL